ncbi:MAG: M43 family zinc metalloprotease [Bacteroidales bacterium]|jgi:hypothetical protein
MKKITAYLFFYFSIISYLYAQENKCGTVVSPEFMKSYKQRIKNEFNKTRNVNIKASTVPDTCLNKEIAITMHIVCDSTGSCKITKSDIDDAFTILNNDFKPICLSFKICKIDTIKNWKYNFFDSQIEEKEIFTLYYNPKTINVYLVEKIKLNGGYPAGYAPLPPSSDYIFLNKSAIKTSISHEMGHYFNLLHTFEISGGAEDADGDNCETAGDLICDTEADIENAQFSGCTYIGSAKDTKGDYITPPICNLMSYHPKACRCCFTTQQYNRMAHAYIYFRKYLY